MLKIEDLIRKAIMVEEIARKHILSSSDAILWPSHDLLKLMKAMLSPSAQDLLAGNKIQKIYKYKDVLDF